MGVFLLSGAAAIFSAVYPVVLPSTLNPLWNLTVENASSSSYTLGLMSIVAAVGVPLVLAYQAWTYWVFRKRISVDSLPGTGGLCTCRGTRGQGSSHGRESLR